MSDLKGLILCAGEARRLRPISHATPKALFPVANQPLLGHAFNALTGAGVTDIGIVISPGDHATPNAIGDGDDWGVRTTYIEQHHPRGLGDAVAQAGDFIGDSPFVLYLGDTVMDQEIAPAVEKFTGDHCDSVLFLAEVDDPRRFGVAEVEGDRVTQLVEKPEHPRTNLAIVGVYMFKSWVLDAIGRTRPSARNELEITDSIQTMIDSGGNVGWLRVEGWWGDVGSPETALETTAHILQSLAHDVRGEIADDCTIEGSASIGAGTVIRGSTIRGPVCIGETCTIEEAEIGPNTCLGDGTAVRRSKISNAILGDECSICCVEGGIAESVFGDRVTVSGKGSEQGLERTWLCADSGLRLGGGGHGE